MMTKLTLDKYLLINNNNNHKFNIHAGFILNNFKIIDFIKFKATTLIQNEKLDLISVIMIHLYGESNIEMIINRFLPSLPAPAAPALPWPQQPLQHHPGHTITAHEPSLTHHCK